MAAPLELLHEPIAHDAASSHPREGMALDEFMRRQDEAPFELIEGVIEPLMSPKAFGSDYFARIVQRALDRTGVGDTFIETTFVLPDTPEKTWIKGSRQPDVLYLADGRLAHYRRERPDWRIKPLMLVPDLAVEIVSPSDRLPKVWRKASIYLDDGVRAVWVVNPMREMVTVFAENEGPFTLDNTGILADEALVPGFALPIAALFADLI